MSTESPSRPRGADRRAWDPAPPQALDMQENPLAAPAAPEDFGPLLSLLRRRWLMLLTVWLVLAPAGAAAILYSIRPTYRATAQIEIAPVVPAILHAEGPMPFFDVYLNTQTELVGSQQVLANALADPAVRDLPIQRNPDPAVALQKSLAVATVPRTNLVEISVTQPDPSSALGLTRAVLDAYLTRAVGLDAQTDRKRRDVLDGGRKALRQQLEQITSEITRAAQEHGAASDSMSEVLRTSMERFSVTTKQEYERAELEVLQIEDRINQLEQGILPDSRSSERDQMIESAGGVAWLRREIQNESIRLTRMQTQLPEGHKDILTTEQILQRLQKRLDLEYQAAAEAADKEIARRYGLRAEEAQVRLQKELDAARKRRDVLKERVRQLDQESLGIGLQSIQIQALREQRDLVRKDYEQVCDALRQMEIESQRPARISVAATPEIRADGVRDRRKKLCAAWAVGCLMLAFVAAMTRDRLDPRLRRVQQLEQAMGLRLLGAVPAVTELRARRITKEVFLDSYRLIRANLSALHPDNRLPRSLLVTSAQACEGKTSLTVSLAISLAEAGQRVLLIDGDMQAPHIAKLLKVSPPHLLASVLKGRRSLASAVVATAIPGVDVLASRTNGNTGSNALHMASAGRVLDAALGLYDCVLVDSPPALGAADALVWARVAEGVILSSLMGTSDINAVRLACRRLAGVHANVLGTVTANVSAGESYYSYSSSSRPEEGAPWRGVRARREPPLVQLPSAPPVDSTAPSAGS